MGCDAPARDADVDEAVADEEAGAGTGLLIASASSVGLYADTAAAELLPRMLLD
jgi:hypothetical protein